MVAKIQALFNMAVFFQSLEGLPHLSILQNASQSVLLCSRLERGTLAKVPFVDDVNLLHAGLSLLELALVDLQLFQLLDHVSPCVPDVGQVAVLQEAEHSRHVGALHQLDVVLMLLIARPQHEDGGVGSIVDGVQRPNLPFVEGISQIELLSLERVEAEITVDSRLVMNCLGRILDVVETFHEQLLLKEAFQSSAESFLLLSFFAPLVEDTSSSADEVPLAISSLKDEHELSSAVLPQ